MHIPRFGMAPASRAASAPRVLLVEDDQDVQDLFGHGLQRQGMSVSTAGDVPFAESLLRVEQYDAAVLDWWLPGGSGIELCRQIRQMPTMAGIPVLLVTANTFLDMAMSVCNGATAVLHKPVSPAYLAATVQRLLDEGPESF